MEHFGERLRRLRGVQSQKTIADALGMPQTTLSSLENQSSVPRGDVVSRLAAFFGVPISYFYLPTPVESSEMAKAWLNKLKVDAKGRDTIAAHSSSLIDASVKEKIAAKLKEKSEEQDAETRKE